LIKLANATPRQEGAKLGAGIPIAIAFRLVNWKRGGKGEGGQPFIGRIAVRWEEKKGNLKCGSCGQPPRKRRIVRREGKNEAMDCSGPRPAMLSPMSSHLRGAPSSPDCGSTQEKPWRRGGPRGATQEEGGGGEAGVVKR